MSCEDGTLCQGQLISRDTFSGASLILNSNWTIIFFYIECRSYYLLLIVCLLHEQCRDEMEWS